MSLEDYGTHLAPLLAACAATDGPILECGAGHSSTPLLHALCAPTKRKLVTLESNPEWLAQFKDLETDWHEFNRVDWGAFDSVSGFDVALVDHGVAPRGPVVAALHGGVRLLVLHDSECRYCDYGPHLIRFDWCWTYKRYPTWATLCGMGQMPEWAKALVPGDNLLPIPYRG